MHPIPLKRTLLASLVWLVGLVGCDQGPRALSLSRLPAPRGGPVYTLGLTPGGQTLVAIARAGVFTRSAEERQWRQVSDPSAAQTPPSSQHHLTRHNARLWWLSQASHTTPPRLLLSADEGASWSAKSLPYPHNTQVPRSVRMGQAAVTVRSNLRLEHQGKQLHLLDEENLWKLERTAVGERWSTVDLEGIDLVSQRTSANFPAALRNFLPATDARDFDVLTTLGDQLMIYRRPRDSQTDWVLSATLPTIDRELASLGERLLLLTPDSLYVGDRFGEQWERHRLIPTENVGEECEQLLVLERDDQAMLLVGLNTGGLLRSVDGGITWRRVRPADPNRRGITALRAPGDGTIWASTSGGGALRSTDFGQTWKPANAGLRSATPLRLDTLNNRLLLGTDAGLFRLRPGAQPSWEQLHDESTSALSSHAGRAWGGTLGGAVVSWREPEEYAVQGQLGGARDAPLFRPHGLRNVNPSPLAILGLERRDSPTTQLAISHRRGMMSSSDGGVTWLEIPPNEALSRALDDAVVVSVMLAPGQTRYMLSATLDDERVAQLWRSDDDGSTWRTVHTFDTERVGQPLELFAPRGVEAETFFLITSRGLFRTTSGGQSWYAVEGPWSTQALLAASPTEDGAVLVTRSEQGVEAFELRELTIDPVPHLPYRLRATSGALDDILGVTLTQDALYLRTAQEVWQARPSDRTNELNYNLTLLIATIVAMTLGSLAFALLRRVDRPRRPRV